jgi:hypothetical protein
MCCKLIYIVSQETWRGILNVTLRWAWNQPRSGTDSAAVVDHLASFKQITAQHCGANLGKHGNVVEIRNVLKLFQSARGVTAPLSPAACPPTRKKSHIEKSTSPVVSLVVQQMGRWVCSHRGDWWWKEGGLGVTASMVPRNWTELRWTELNWAELRWAKLYWIEFRVELSWAEMNWTELNGTQMNWLARLTTEHLTRSNTTICNTKTPSTMEFAHTFTA